MTNEYDKIYFKIWSEKLTGTLFKRSPTNRIYIKRYENGTAVTGFIRYFSKAMLLFKNNECYIFREDQHENASVSD